jgi:nitroreductase
MQTTITKRTFPGAETMNTIYCRRSVRKYTNKAVDKKMIEQIIDAGRIAPSAINKQPWKFYVLTDKEMIKSFSKEISAVAVKGFVRSGAKGIVDVASHLLHLAHGSNFHAMEDPVFHGAPVVVFLTAPRDNEWASLDIGMCAQNMMLAAKSLGLESCPVGLGKYIEKTKHFPSLKVPPGEQILLSVIFGYGNEKPELHERKKENIVFVD